MLFPSLGTPGEGEGGEAELGEKGLEHQIALGGNLPNRRRVWRTAIRWGVLIARTATVVLPTAVIPAKVPPSQRKCVGQVSIRGLNSRVNCPLWGSRPAMFGPLCRLQRPQQSARFSSVVGPPCWEAMMWSATWCSVEADSGNWHYSQMYRARSLTRCSRDLSMAASSGRGLRPQRRLSLGLDDGEEVVDVQIIFQFAALFRAELAFRGFRLPAKIT